MATITVQQQEFINKIAASVKKYAPQFGIKVHSPIIAQACLESSFGTSTKGKKNNFFGLKYRKNRVTCHSGTFKDGSVEQEKNGNYTKITDDWYEFPSLDAGVLGYFQFINIANYSNVKGVTDPREYLTKLKEDKYATDQKYVEKLMNVITKYNLTRYDKKEGGGSQMEINKDYPCDPSNHGGTRNTNTIKFIVIHYTGNATDKAVNNAKYFQGKNRKASAHYFVDDTSIYQSVADDIIAWSVGGKKYPSCATTGGGKFYGICTNTNSISIELCSINSQITEKTQENARWLVKGLMDKYNVPISNVIRHFDVLGKSCPGWTLNTDAAFSTFKAKIGATTTPPPIEIHTSPTPIGKGGVTARVLNVRNKPSTEGAVVGTLLQNTVVMVYEKTDTGWLKISNISEKWVSEKYISMLK